VGRANTFAERATVTATTIRRPRENREFVRDMESGPGEIGDRRQSSYSEPVA
jgi:hypothetical protein